MTTETQTPKTTTKTRSANIATLTNGKQALWLTVGDERSAYLVTPLASDFGAAFHLSKTIDGDGKGGEEYDVLLHGQQSSCTCPGHSFRSKCKHLDALTALVQSGKLAVLEPEPVPEREDEETVESTEQPPQPEEKQHYCPECRKWSSNPFCLDCSI
jgi:hypothetical protein